MITRQKIHNKKRGKKNMTEDDKKILKAAEKQLTALAGMLTLLSDEAITALDEQKNRDLSQDIEWLEEFAKTLDEMTD